MTQCEKIIRHLEEHGSITSLEAVKEYGIMRLASRICNLKAQGYDIVSDFVCSTNRYGEKVYFSQYRVRS